MHISKRSSSSYSMLFSMSTLINQCTKLELIACATSKLYDFVTYCIVDVCVHFSFIIHSKLSFNSVSCCDFVVVVAGWRFSSHCFIAFEYVNCWHDVQRASCFFNHPKERLFAYIINRFESPSSMCIELDVFNW